MAAILNNVFFEKFKLKRFAIPGDKADEEVVVPAGDTGIPAGPMLSVFGKLKIQTKVQEGKIHVVKDTVVAKPGDPIPVEIIPILQKLGIMPVHVKLKVKAAYYENLVIPGEKLHLDLEGYKNDVLRAFSEAFTLATEAVYPEPKVLENVLSKAFARGRALSRSSREAGSPQYWLWLGKGLPSISPARASAVWGCDPSWRRGL